MERTRRNRRCACPAAPSPGSRRKARRRRSRGECRRVDRLRRALRLLPGDGAAGQAQRRFRRARSIDPPTRWRASTASHCRPRPPKCRNRLSPALRAGVGDCKETEMRFSHPSILLAANLVAFGAMQAAAGGLCKPALSLRDVRISEPRNSQRTWSGVLVVDASPCSTTSGAFEIEFTRLKETAPDLRFSERFTWASGRSEVSIDMWWDEWFEDYRIAHIATCPCRD